MRPAELAVPLAEAHRLLAEPLADDAAPAALSQLVQTRAVLRRLVFLLGELVDEQATP